MDSKIPDWMENANNNLFMNDPTSTLGLIIFSFQELEHALVELLGQLLGNVEYARIIASEISFYKIINIIESIMYQNNVKSIVIDEFSELKKELKRVEEDRNKYVHSYYEIVEYHGSYIKYLRMKDKNKTGLKTMIEVIDNHEVFEKLLIELVIYLFVLQILKYKTKINTALNTSMYLGFLIRWPKYFI